MIKHVYIHIPFCLRKCGYCSFFSLPYGKDTLDKYLKALHSEIELYSHIYELRPETVYFGGGTPSLMKSAEFTKILSHFDLQDLIECTVEVNPATVDEDDVRGLADTAVNRISLGVQSANDNELVLLGRLHSVRESIQTYNLFREQGFNNISIDIIYGVNERTAQDVRLKIAGTEKLITELNSEHISCYGLSLEPETVLKRNGHQLPQDEISSDIYRFLCEMITDKNYEQYEISNYAKDGYRSLHNSGYWLMEDYIGFGAGAHSFVENIRYNNPASLNQYYDNVSAGKMMPCSKKQTVRDVRNDYVIQGLRLAEGLSFASYRSRFGEDFEDRYNKAIMKYDKYLVKDKSSLKLKPESYFVSNEIITGFLE